MTRLPKLWLLTLAVMTIAGLVALLDGVAVVKRSRMSKQGCCGVEGHAGVSGLRPVGEPRGVPSSRENCEPESSPASSLAY